MKTKSKKSYLISFCLTFVACLMAFAFTLGINKVNAINSGDLDAMSISISSQSKTTTYTQNGIRSVSAADAIKQYRIVVANLEETFSSDDVISIIVKTDIIEGNSRFTPILFDKYGNFYQGVGAGNDLNPNGDKNYEYKVSNTLDGLDTAATTTCSGYSYFGWGKSNEWYWELKLDTFMWRYAPTNYGLVENTLSLAKGDYFGEVKDGNAIMSVGMMIGTGNASAHDMTLDGYYVRTSKGIFSLLDFTKLSLSTVAITSTTTDTEANKVFVAHIPSNLQAVSTVTLSFTKEEGSFFDGVKLDVRQNAQYKGFGFRLDETGANTKYNGKFTDVESIIMQVHTSNGVSVRPMIVDEYGRFTEAFGGNDGPFQSIRGTSIETLTAKRNNSEYTSHGNWSAATLSELDTYLEVPIDSFRVRARFKNFGGTTTADDITKFSKGSDINVKLLTLINNSSITEGQIYIGDMYYRKTSGEVVKVGNAKDFTFAETIDASAGSAVEFSTSTGTNAKITGQTEFYDESYTARLFGQNIVANAQSEYEDFRIYLPQVKSTSATVDMVNADCLISDYSGYEAFSYSINNFTKTDLTLDFYVQTRKEDGVWKADRYAGQKDTKALYVPDNGNEPFVYASNKVPAGFDGKVYIPLSDAGFGSLSRQELKVMSSIIYGKLDAETNLNFKLDNVKLVVDFPDTVIDEENNIVFGLDGEVDKDVWLDEVLEPDNYAYSFMVIGDTQVLSANKYYDETDIGLDSVYNYVIDNIDSKKVECVIGLGDITELDYEGEWEEAVKQISRFDDKVRYTLIRGNHDGKVNYQNYVTSGTNYVNQIDEWYIDGDILNVAQTFTAGNLDYLVISMDFGASDDILNWAAGLCEKYPNHNVIITTHAYLYRDGTTLDKGDSDGWPPTRYDGANNNGDDMWEKLIKKHPNIVMVLSGHVDSESVVLTQTAGDNGNIVSQFLIDPQGVDVDYADGLGLVSTFYFSEDGKTVTVDWYSTVKQKYFMADSQFTFTVNTIERAKVSFTDKDGNVTEEVFNGEAIVLPETVVSPEGQVFVGWSNGDKIYPAGYKVTFLTSDMTFEPVFMAFEMTKGASVRLDDPTGIRFQAKVTNAMYEDLIATYGEANVKLGMRIIRGGTHYVDIDAENYNVRDIDGVDVLIYNGVVANINEANYQVEYEGKAYIEITYADNTTSRIYAVANDNVRSIAEVAQSACEDPNTTLSQAQIEKLEKYYK